METERIGDKSPHYSGFTKAEEVKNYLQNSDVYVILSNGRPVGHVSYKALDKRTVEIDGLVVFPSYRRKGIATKAVEMIIRKISNYHQAELLTHPHNIGSLLIYLRNGFVIESWEDNPFGDGEPRVKMVKLLT